MKTTKIQWIDWMKVITMFFVIWGHCFPELMSSFIYAFNVPAFFILSGFLTRKHDESSSFYGKFTRNLLIPYLLLAFLKCAGAIIKGFNNGEWYISIAAILGGFHSINDIQGCSNLWFVYSLMIVRLLHHLIKGSLKYLIVLSFISTVAACLLALNYEMPKWAVSNTLIALPFFTIGHIFRTALRERFDKFIETIKNSNRILLFFAMACVAVIIYAIGEVNGEAALYHGYYGTSIILLFIGAILGTIMLVIPSVCLDSFSPKWLAFLAAGNIVTLTFHRELLHSPLKMITHSEMSPWIQDACSFLASFAVLACFIPINWIVSKYMPVFIGLRAKNANDQTPTPQTNK